MNTAHKIFNIVSFIVWPVIIFCIVIILLLNIPALRLSFLNFQTYIITSPSMEPTLKTGDIIFIKPETQYQLDTIVTFEDAKERTITHRLVSEDTETAGNFITKGDNNDTVDSHSVSPKNILGKFYFGIPLIGYFIVNVQNPLGMTILLGVPISLIIIEFVFFQKKSTEKPSEQSDV